MSMEIGFPTLLGILLLPAVTFALAYAPIMSRFSRGLISPYSKADVRKRFSAAVVDGLLAITLSFGYWTGNSPLYLAVGAGYLLLRDAIGGQSVGKLVFGLVVIDLMSGRAASVSASARRNLLLLLPGANVVAVFLEARTIAVDPQGQRLGDRLAHTQVVEGAGARDLVKSFQDWLMSLGRGLGQATGGRRRVPGRIDFASWRGPHSSTRCRATRLRNVRSTGATSRQGGAKEDASERSEVSHANGASRRRGSRESV